MLRARSYKNKHFSCVKLPFLGLFHRYYLQLHSITPSGKSNPRYFTVTHCFHPLYKRTFKLVEYYHNWGQKKVSFFNDEGRLTFLPPQWTDIVPQDPFVNLAGGKAYFHYNDLIELSKFLQKICFKDNQK